jgi:hypothetical protein
MFKLFPVTSMGGSINEQIPSQLSRVRSLLRVQAAICHSAPRCASFLRHHQQSCPHRLMAGKSKVKGER